MGKAKEEFLTDTAVKKGQRDHEGKKKNTKGDMNCKSTEVVQTI